MQTVPDSDPIAKTPRPWLFSGGLEPIALVDKARAALGDDAGGILEGAPTTGVRSDACYRRIAAAGGRPGLTAATLEAARIGLDRYRGRQWRQTDEATIEEIRARSATPADYGARRANEIPQWFRCEGSDGARIVPRRLQPLVAMLWWAYASGRFGVLASTVELGAELGVAPRTIRAWRREGVRLGLIRKGEHILRDKADQVIEHDEAIRTWRPGRFARPCDRGRNLYRVGPVLEALAGDTVAHRDARTPRRAGKARPPRRDARKAAGALRRAGRLAAYRRTGEVWDREVGRLASPSASPRRGPRPIDPERLARTAIDAPMPRPKRSAASASSVIGRIKDPGTPDPNGPSAGRGLGPRTPTPPRFARESAGARCSASPSAAPPTRGADASPVPPAASPTGSAAQTPTMRPEPPPRRRARDVPDRRPPLRPPDDDDRRLADSLARLGAVIWGGDGRR